MRKTMTERKGERDKKQTLRQEKGGKTEKIERERQKNSKI